MILFRYLTRQIFSTTFALTLVLLLIIMSGRFIKYLASVASGDMSAGILSLLMFYRLPGFIELILPLGFFLSILLVLGRMYIDNEVTVLHAGGVSRDQLAFYILSLSFCMAIFMGIVSCFLTPIGAKKFSEIWNDPNNFRGLSTLVEGKFQSTRGTGWVSYTEELSSDKTKLGLVFMAHVAVDKDSNEALMIAQQGRVLQKQENRYIELEKGIRYEGNPGQLDYQITEFQQIGQVLEVSKNSSQKLDPEAQSMGALWLSSQPEDKAIFHWRLGIPISLWIMSLLAFSLSKADPRKGRFLTLLPALVLYVFYVFLMSAGKNYISEEKLPVWLGLWWLHSIFLMLTVIVYYFETWQRLYAASRTKNILEK